MLFYRMPGCNGRDAGCKEVFGILTGLRLISDGPISGDHLVDRVGRQRQGINDPQRRHDGLRETK